MIMPNHFGRDSELRIRTRMAEGAAALEYSFFTAPYKIAKPFYDGNKKMTNIMVMSASAGIMEGDCYRISVELGEGIQNGAAGTVL